MSVYEPGKSGNPRGRPPGSLNKLTRTVKDAFEHVFNELQGDGYKGAQVSLEEWAVGNTTEFYKLAKVLIPQKLEHAGGVNVSVVTGIPTAEDDSHTDIA